MARRKLKVFGTAMLVGRWADGTRVSGRQARVVMACTSMREFSVATGSGKDFISETGNGQEIAAATSRPGRLLFFDAPMHHSDGEYREVPDAGYRVGWFEAGYHMIRHDGSGYADPSDAVRVRIRRRRRRA